MGLNNNFGGYCYSQHLRLSMFFTTSSFLSLLLSIAWLTCEHIEVSRDLSYPALLVVLLTARRGSILDRGGESIEVKIKSEERKDEENISYKAHIKEISNEKREADDTCEQSIKDHEDSNLEEKSDVINRAINKTPEN